MTTSNHRRFGVMLYGYLFPPLLGLLIAAVVESPWPFVTGCGWVIGFACGRRRIFHS